MGSGTQNDNEFQTQMKHLVEIVTHHSNNEELVEEAISRVLGNPATAASTPTTSLPSVAPSSSSGPEMQVVLDHDNYDDEDEDEEEDEMEKAQSEPTTTRRSKRTRQTSNQSHYTGAIASLPTPTEESEVRTAKKYSASKHWDLLIMCHWDEWVEK